MNSKAQIELLYSVMEVLIAVLFLVTSLMYVRSVATSQTFEKQFLATDLALALDTIQAASGNMVFVFQPQKKDFGTNYSYKITQGEVEVFLNASEGKKGRHFFAIDPLFEFRETELVYRDNMI